MVPGKRGRPAREAPPRVFLRRGVYASDFRRWNAGRVTLRDPDAPGWPNGGETTDDEEVALRWALAYVDHFRDSKRRRHLKLGPRPKRLAESAEEWIERRKITQPVNTWMGNRSGLNALRRFAAADRESGCKGDDLKTDRITRPLLQRMFDGLLAEGYALNTLVGYRQAIHLFLQYLGHGAVNSATGVKLPKEDHEEVSTWTDEEMDAIRAAADRLDRAPRFAFRRHRLAVELAVTSGLRKSELFAVDWRRIDPDTRTVRVVRQMGRQAREFVVPKSKKPRTALLLPGWWDFHRSDATGLVLAGDDGYVLQPQSLTKVIRRLLSEAELDRPGFGWHTFRHTYARDFIVGVRGDFGLLQKSLGHQSIVTTEKLYSHFHSDVAAELARQRLYPDERLRAV